MDTPHAATANPSPDPRAAAVDTFAWPGSARSGLTGPGLRARMALLTVLALTCSLLPAVLAPPAAEAAIDAVREADFIALVNVERARNDLPALSPRTDIRDVARKHSVKMAQEARLHHNPTFSQEITNWQVVGENVGRGPSVESLHRALMNSEGHRANILHERYTQIGVGVEVRDGQVWVTQNFRRPKGTVTTGTPSTTVYGDVPNTHVHVKGILAVTSSGITEQCGIARFCPSSSVTRADFVVMLAKALQVEPAATSRFTDMSGPSAGYAEALAARGIVAGTSTTTFSPDRLLTREQLATLFARALQLEPRTPAFTDVRSVHAGNVGALAYRGIVRGCTTTTYCPGADVTRAQVATMLHNEFS